MLSRTAVGAVAVVPVTFASNQGHFLFFITISACVLTKAYLLIRST